jgi:hypothetical protein
MPSKNYKPKPVAHRALKRRTNGLNAAVNEAIDALETATRRERVLNDGEPERRADLEQIYPVINKEHR